MATSFFNDLMQGLTVRGRSLLGRGRGPVGSDDLADLADALLSRRGEASGVVLARSLFDGYERAPLSVRLGFLTALAERFGADASKLDAAVKRYGADQSARSALAIHAAAEARRQELFRRLNLASGGTAALVRMRAELIDHLAARPDLRPVDDDFAHLFASWFNRGFLFMRPIDWATPANILEKIIRYEAVHDIEGWDDLRRRLAPPDRRCFAFFHPQLVDEPLIFVEVALTANIPGAVAPLLAPDRAPIRSEDATTAVFYSISNTQKGLAGVSFGHFLIKQVADDLKRDLPQLKTFVTLSPVPGFRGWLDAERQAASSRWLTREDRESLWFLDDPGWADNAEMCERVGRAMRPAAAAYLLAARNDRNRPLDPVARFHLGNGARLERIQVLGDPSAKGMRQSHGLMVNYLYDLGEIERNHEAYAERGEVAAAPAIRKLVRTDGVTQPAAAAEITDIR